MVGSGDCKSHIAQTQETLPCYSRGLLCAEIHLYLGEVPGFWMFLINKVSGLGRLRNLKISKNNFGHSCKMHGDTDLVLQFDYVCFLGLSESSWVWFFHEIPEPEPELHILRVLAVYIALGVKCQTGPTLFVNPPKLSETQPCTSILWLQALLCPILPSLMPARVYQLHLRCSDALWDECDVML